MLKLPTISLFYQSTLSNFYLDFPFVNSFYDKLFSYLLFSIVSGLILTITFLLFKKNPFLGFKIHPVGFTPYRLVQGFTLVELLVGMAIVAILAVVSIALFSGSQKNARDAQRMADINAIAKAMETNYIPGTGYTFLRNSWFGSGRIPIDPYCTYGTDTYYTPSCSYDSSSAPNNAVCDTSLGTNTAVCKYCVGQLLNNPPAAGACNGTGSGFSRVQTARQTSASAGYPQGGSGFPYWIVCANLEGSGGNANNGRSYCKSNQQS